MKKKIVVLFMALIGFLSMGYGYHYVLHAATGVSGGMVTGRINMAPANLTVNNLGLRKGDKFYLNVLNPLTNDKLGWLLVGADDGVSGIAMTTEAISNAIQASSTSPRYDTPYQNTNLPSVMDPFIASMQSADASFLLERKLDNINKLDYLGTTYNPWPEFSFYTSSHNGDYISGKSPYLIGGQVDTSWTTTNTSIPASQGNFISPYDVYTRDIYCDFNFWDAHAGRNTNSGPKTGIWGMFQSTSTSGAQPYTSLAYVRPAAHIDLSQVVFSVSQGSSVGMAEIKPFTLPSSYSNLGKETADSKGNYTMKLRVLDSSLNASLSAIRNNSNQVITKINKNKKIYLDADANTGTNHTVSVLIFDSTNTFKYYQPLETAKGSGLYEVDLTGIPTGTYRIGIVNEEYDAGSSKPTNSSRITNVMPLEIVEPHKLSYTKQPQSGASSGKDYEFSKNVNAGQTVGKITVNPQGVMPLTYTVESNGDNSYQNFEIDGLNSSHASSNASLNVKIKSGAPDLINGGLKAGTYRFCINSVDANGDPTTATADSRVCTSFTVEKTQSTIQFDNDDKGTTYVSGSTSATTNHSEHATHTNKDSSNNDVDIEYSYVSGNSSILSGGLPFTSTSAGDQANIVFAANVSGSIVIQAKIPASDNYEAATTTKTLTLQLGIVGNYVEDKTNIKAGSSEAKPPTTYAQANRIGYIDVSGGTAPFTYTLPSGKGNNGSFHIDNSGNVYVNQSVGSGGLTPGDYDIEVEVKDSTSPTKQTTTVKKKITIGAAALSGVGWEDPNHAGHALASNTYEITYDPSGEPNNGGTFHTKLMETTSGTLASTVISYTLDPDPNDVISISGSSTVSAVVKKASDSSTLNNVKIKAHITGGIYGSTGVDTELFVNVKKYPQTIAFNNTSVLKLPVGSACVSVPADITSTYSKPGETISYTSSDTGSNAPFTINASGEVCPTSNASDAGSATLTGTLQGDDNYETAITQTGRVIQVYVPGNIEVTGSIDNGGTSGVTYTPDSTLKKALDTSSNPNGGTAKSGTAVAQVSVAGSTFKLGGGSGNKNADANYFTVTSTGYITLKQDITANDIKNHGTGNKYYLQVDVTDSENNTRTVDIIIVIEDAQADFYFVDPISGTKLSLSDTFGTINVPVYKATYSPNGTLNVKTNLSATYSEVTAAEATGIDIDEDVIDHNSLNHFTILNASDPDGNYGSGGDAYVKACMSKGDGYAAQCIYAKVIIEKAEQNGFAFVHQPKWTVGKDPATIEPTYNGKLSNGDVLLKSSDDTLAEIQAPIKGQNQSFKTMDKVGTVTLTATAPEDRNYKRKEATTTLEISEKPPTTLQLYAEPMTYGDTNKTAKIISGYKKGIPTYFYVDDTSILNLDSSAVNDKERDKIKAIGSGQVTIKVCQTNDAFDPAVDDCNAIGGDYGEVTITVKKKPITLTYQDETIYVGESFPTYKFIKPDASAFVFTDSIADFPIPKNTSAKKDGTAISDTETKGTYDISGSYGSGELSGNTKHYEIQLQSGKLTINQDEAQANWYHLEDPSGNTVSASDWHNTFVDVVIDSVNAAAGAGTYDQISDTIHFTNVNKQRFTITNEDDYLTDIYFRIDPTGSDPHKGAISDKLQDHVKIDMTKPNVLSITGYPVNNNGVSNILNEITLGHYFKPGVQVEIKVEDPQPAGTKTKVQISGIKEVSYRIYALDDSGNMTSTTPITMDTGTPGSNDILSFKINDIGNYRVCATVTDNAMNESTEKCSDLNIKKIDVDIDGDGKPDFNDPDGDGCPDLNIKWKDPSDPDKWIIINGDRDNDSIPDLNIDSDGDGKADLNIDSDHDGKPDLNLVLLKNTDSQGTPAVWKPTKCVKKDITKGILEEYCTGTNVKPIINVDLDNDGIPDINIDNKGDFKPHLNIAKDGVNPIINITTIHDWKPLKDYKSSKFTYDSIGMAANDPKPELNIDSDGDGYPDLNLDLDGDGVPDLNVDVDGDYIPDMNIDSTGDGKPDISVDTTKDGKPDTNIVVLKEWKPERNVDGDFPYDTMDITKPQEPSDPDNPQEPINPTEPVQQGNASGGSVQGYYHPQESVGGANTGDTTNLMMYLGISLGSLGILVLVNYKKKAES